ncbi:hypothetical protein M427DRAFT_313673 [Gonapodya prolifera JEL478]|uniref:Uncharacterized protein n=1 Tax=Gonapodya prolifera (strain JEL478) TaxID=1344416 RepID=A0A139AWW2_GONPJ|nr:hypothetical protein M427DRAFT_313673 [Gonapodya prolifera JEL478]|eukprot:KXS21208.1 hypothetical protein M427DRAFT_313673 [Gonapodya prolifera JEL478]
MSLLLLHIVYCSVKLKGSQLDLVVLCYITCQTRHDTRNFQHAWPPLHRRIPKRVPPLLARRNREIFQPVLQSRCPGRHVNPLCPPCRKGCVDRVGNLRGPRKAVHELGTRVAPEFVDEDRDGAEVGLCERDGAVDEGDGAGKCEGEDGFHHVKEPDCSWS